MTAPLHFTPRRMADEIGVEIKIVYNVIAAFKIQVAHEVGQQKYYQAWVLEAIRAECIRRKRKHEAAQKKKWLKTLSGRLAEAFKKGRGCFLTQKQVRDLCLMPTVRQMIAHAAAELQIDEDSESKTTTL